MPNLFIAHQPLVNRQGRIIATRLSLHGNGGETTKNVLSTLENLQDIWPQGEKQVFVNIGKIPCDATLFNWDFPKNITFEVPSSAFIGDAAPDFMAAIKAKNPPLCLLFDTQAQAVLANPARFRFIGFDAQRYTPVQLKSLAVQNQTFGIGVALNVYDAKSFQACLDAGLNAAATWFFKTPTVAPAKTLNAAYTNIIRVLNLVRKNADIKEIEAALKQDVAISYKLLRYINSVGFGLSCEIQSFKHAVTILGYNKLNRWLSLLLATASKDPLAPALMYTALIRARLMELLAQDLVDPHEHDNLFVAGAFSMLDAVLGVSMDKVLESLSLPESICDALLARGGIYGPFLDLAKTGEGEDGGSLALQVGALGLSATQYNRAKLEALAFAESITL